MQKPKSFRPWQPEQTTLLPPSPREWLSADHQVYFLLDLVDELDLTAILIPAQAKDPRGEKGFDPRMMTFLLLYAYCVGIVSSRKIERACYEDLSFRVLTGNQQPDHTRISEFRRRNLDALRGLFVLTLRLCQKAGMVSLGHVALDGTKVQANASKHKAMSHERMLKAEKQLQQEINALMRKAEILDAQEDRRYGKGSWAATCPTNCGGGRIGWPGSVRPARRWKRRPLLLQRVSGTRRQKRPRPKPLPPGTRRHRQQSRPS
ncbi:transposase [Vulcanococcus limneticus]|uniref:transposase n=1 Tax=Vulcanococcus limneticus TaxID=2170428 RepID=UPI00398BC6AE